MNPSGQNDFVLDAALPTQTAKYHCFEPKQSHVTKKIPETSFSVKNLDSTVTKKIKSVELNPWFQRLIPAVAMASLI